MSIPLSSQPGLGSKIKKAYTASNYSIENRIWMSPFCLQRFCRRYHDLNFIFNPLEAKELTKSWYPHLVSTIDIYPYIPWKYIQQTKIFFFSGMVAANSGLCPGYPKVSPRDKTCFITPNCKKDSDCIQIRGKSRKSQKCCENPCGVTLCQDVDPVKAKLRELGERLIIFLDYLAQWCGRV